MQPAAPIVSPPPPLFLKFAFTCLATRGKRAAELVQRAVWHDDSAILHLPYPHHGQFTRATGFENLVRAW